MIVIKEVIPLDFVLLHKAAYHLGMAELASDL